METKNVHTLVLGAGPAGLAAGYTLAQAGLAPVIVDRGTAPGGLMRSVHRGDFVVDVGRKELYNRLAKVDDFWGALLGADYRPYPHRGGYLYEGQILEMSRSPRGFRRGMPWPMFLRCVFDLLFGRLNVFAPKPRNVEEHFYRTRGRLLTRVASQGFQEKLTGKRWAELPLPTGFTDTNRHGLLTTLGAAATRAFSNKQVNTYKGQWRHPAKGTDQICDALSEGITKAGGSFVLGAKIQKASAVGSRVETVVAEVDSEQVSYRPEFVVSSVPLEVMITMLGRKLPEAYGTRDGAPAKRTVVLVYLFLDRPSLFPHAWLQVTCPSTRIGRIANYPGFGGDMVPPGKGCLCCEYYAFGDDPLLQVDQETLVSQTVDYCVSAGLIEPDSLQDELVLKFPGADASQNRHNWMTSMRSGLLDEVKPLTNLYHVGRTDLDIATLAGIESAEAIIGGDRSVFDRHFDPTEIGIRSEPKAFEFKLPEGVG